MEKKPINQVLAENLKHFMKKGGLTQATLGNKAGVAQTAIGFYLRPERRQTSKSGKDPSATLSQVGRLADALGVEIWQLLRSFTPQERIAYEQIEKAFRSLNPPSEPPPEQEQLDLIEETAAAEEKPKRTRRPSVKKTSKRVA